ncbi:MAG: glycoside hydrolase family 2 protein [Pseudobutyrivibrio sp.]|nr:glycoside hydrolase family 2 protein [Pseudobutyrivibrio sp.]
MKTLFNDGWSFKKIPFQENYDYDKARTLQGLSLVALPHDYLIYDCHNLYENSIGVYKKNFFIDRILDKHYEIYFEGVYMDSSVYLNGVHLGDWKYGYSSFHYNMDEAIVEGENELTVIVRHQSYNSRWYSGAGIYRNVYLICCDANHFVTDGFYITTVKNKRHYDLVVEFDVVMDFNSEASIRIQLYDNLMHEIVDAKYKLTEVTINNHILVTIGDLQVKEWSADEPNLYSFKAGLVYKDKIIDDYKTNIGFRYIEFDPSKGMVVNGKHTKLRGMCLHHDLGALGAAVNRAAVKRQLEIMKNMGCNAIRTAHNMPSAELLDICDEMGFFVVDEAFDMWQSPKNPYDYARFFDEWQAKDVASWIRRDCNHPSVIMWSIGNEIADTHTSKEGPNLTSLLKSEVEAIDYRGHAMVTIGSNYMPWEGARACADVVKLSGYNYGEKYYDSHHDMYPDWCIYGSETGSVVASRGIYHFPYSASKLADEDMQCSALGNSSTSWGAKSVEQCIYDDETREYSLGQFVWSGFDYIGEPTPYHTKNSYFGQVDTAGFPKDSYYIFKAAWTPIDKECVLHIFPYWCFNEGQLIDVRVATNAPKVELFLNGVSLGVSHDNIWQLKYVPGEIEAVAYDADNKIIASTLRHSFGDPYRLDIREVNAHEHVAGTRDLIFYEVNCLDNEGNPVENANNLIQVMVSGTGSIAGLDNGDSTDYCNYKSDAKRLFSGKLLIMIAVHDEKGDVVVEISSPGLVGTTITTAVTKQDVTAGWGTYIPEPLSHTVLDYTMEPYRVELIWLNESKLCAKLHPKCCNNKKYWDRLQFKAVSEKGYELGYARLTKKDNFAYITAISDGDYRIRCTYSNKTGEVKLISELEHSIKGLKKAWVNPYEMIVGSSYSRSEGEITSGNEYGVATARDGRTVVSYDGLDFGDYGANTIHLPVFELAGARCPIEIWQGYPGEKGAVLIDILIYEKPSIWNTYQEQVYILPNRVQGVATISFVLNQKIHLKGFYFDRLKKAYDKLTPKEASSVYGDDFVRTDEAILGIGNNVTIEYDEMDFGCEGATKVIICGRTQNLILPIHIDVEGDGGSSRQIVEFTASEEYKNMSFDIKKISKNVKVSLIFMPGSQFDFKSIQFFS